MSGETSELWLAWLHPLAEPLGALETRDPLAPPGELDGLDGARRVARMALRRLLARCFGREAAARAFTFGAHGKPQIAGLGGDFNLSHSSRPRSGGEGWEAVALIGVGKVAAIGVDLEPARAVRLDARRRAAIIEAALLVGDGAPLPDDQQAAMIQAWARLEAWGKATGRGIGRTLSHFGIWGHAGRTSLTDAAERVHSGGLTVHDVPVAPDLFAAVALPRGAVRPAVRLLPPDVAALDAVFDGSGSGLNSGVDLAPRAGQKGPIGA